MFKLKFVVSLLVAGLVACASAATPPACVLACVNEQEKHNDLKAICAATSAQDCLSDRCNSGEYDTAEKYFQSICKEHNHEVADSAEPSGSASASSAKPTTSSSAKPTTTKDEAIASTTAGSDAPNASSSADQESAGNRLTGGNGATYVVLVAMALFALG